ncbi:MAG: polyketide synthase [Lentisphaerae bacterium]|nr:polyketide synthase [Lentisphaerota bacterium]
MKIIQDEIAIIGMAGVFPDAPDLAAFWENIVAKHCSISDHPDPRAMDWLDPNSTAFGRVYSLRGGYLKDLARFDPIQFGVPPNSVASGDLDQFLTVRIATEALHDAGLRDGDFPRERTEVVLGHATTFHPGLVNWFQHGLGLDQTLAVIRGLHPDLTPDETERLRAHLGRTLPEMTAQTPPTLLPNIVAGRTANRLDLMGANYILDGACASSAIAIDNAMKDLLLDRCDLALAGGAQACVSPLELMLFCSIGAISRHAALRPFDQAADGTMLGEGTGILVLKRQRDAERDGNRIYAIIKGVGVASDGRGRGMMAPRPEGAMLAMRRAFQYAEVDPASIGMVEAHGTGIPLGDRTEIGALRTVYGARRGHYPTTAVGSVKSNIGHCRPAAGIAGVIKATMALHHKVLPPTANCDTPHPALELETTPFYVSTEARPWIHGNADLPRRAAVNALGFGGIDSHCILEEYRNA